MTVSIEKTAKKYHGRKATTYDTVREKQERWDLENKIVGEMLRGLRPKSVLDVPVGSGRFLRLYDGLDVKLVVGVDVSDSMISLARLKQRRLKNSSRVTLHVGDARKIDAREKYFDCSVCVRFLDLIDEASMQKVVRELARVTERAIVVTIRLGEVYVPKSNTAEHDRRKFRRLVDQVGFKVTEEVPIFNAGWVVAKMERK